MSLPDSTLIALVLDASGSMGGVIGNVNSGIEAFIDRQRQLNKPCELVITTFASDIQYITRGKDIQKFAYPKRGYGTRGSTALYDGIGLTATDIQRKIAALPEAQRPEKVIVITVTDGEENASQQWSLTDIKGMIEHYEESYGWDFLFVGSNQHAYETGKRMGIKAGKALSMANSAAGVDFALKAIADSVYRYRDNGAPAADQFFTRDDHDRQAGMGAKRSPYSSIV